MTTRKRLAVTLCIFLDGLPRCLRSTFHEHASYRGMLGLTRANISPNVRLTVMTFRNARKSPRPLLPHEEIGQELRFAKSYRDRDDREMIDTSELEHSKIHPTRCREFLTWLRFQPCAIVGREDSATGQRHTCWSLERLGAGYLSDPAHTGKAYSGKLKRDDRGAFPLCRHAHRQQEDNMDSFDARFGIDRHEIAREMWERFSEKH